MAFDISKYSKGLPALLGLKERGRGLPVLADQLVGTLDTKELYLLDTREVLQEAGVNAAIGTVYFTTIVVPAGELWYVWEYGVTSSPGAGAAVDIAPIYNPEGTSAAALVGPFKAAAATQFAFAGATRPFWAGPGSAFGCAVASQTLVPTVNGKAVITRLRV